MKIPYCIVPPLGGLPATAGRWCYTSGKIAIRSCFAASIIYHVIGLLRNPAFR